MHSTKKPTAPFRRSLLAILLAAACGGEKIVDVTLDPALIVLATLDAGFTVMEGEADPSPVEIGVTNGGEEGLTGLNAAIEYGVGHTTDWLDVTLNATTAPATLSLAPRTTQLPPGRYEADVHVMSADAENSPQAVAVTLDVEPGPQPARIALDENRIEWEVMEGVGDPPPATVHVTNVGELPLGGLGVDIAYRNGEPEGWLTASLDGPEAPADLQVEASASGLAAGSYQATISVRSDAASNSPERLRVDLVVTANDPLIVVSPEYIRFVATEGLGNPDPRNVQVTNGGLGSLDALSVEVAYAPGGATGWLSTSLSTTTAPAIVTLNASTGSLAVGSHEARVIVGSPVARNEADTVDVEFVVREPGPIIAVSPTFIAFNAIVNGPPPVAQSAEVTNAQAGELTDLSVTISSGDEGWLSASLDGTTAPATITITVNAAGLPIDTYQGDVWVESPVAENVTGGESIGVRLTIADGLPDLTIVGGVTTTTSVEAGFTVDLPDATEKNVGVANAPSHFIGFYLSTDSMITAADTRLDGRSMSGFDPGEERPGGDGQVLIPVDTPPGEYFIGVLVDEGNSVTEEDESNNFVSTAITITPALTRYTLTVVETPGAGGWIDAGPERVFVEGESVTLTAYPYPGFLFGGWTGDATGDDNPVVVVMDADKSISADFVIPAPTFGAYALIGGVQASWSYTWPCVLGPNGCATSPDDRFELEESLTPDPADFQVIYTSTTGRETNGQLQLQRPPGVHYYRFRALGDGWASPYSDIVEVDPRPAPASRR